METNAWTKKCMEYLKGGESQRYGQAFLQLNLFCYKISPKYRFLYTEEHNASVEWSHKKNQSYETLKRPYVCALMNMH